MGSFIVEGGHKLKGNVIPQGAKNEALQILCGVLLTQEEMIIRNVPNIVDINKLIDLLKALGVEVNKLSENDYSFKAENVNLEYLESEEFKKKGASLRGSIMIVGPLLAEWA